MIMRHRILYIIIGIFVAFSLFLVAPCNTPMPGSDWTRQFRISTNPIIFNPHPFAGGYRVLGVSDSSKSVYITGNYSYGDLDPGWGVNLQMPGTGSYLFLVGYDGVFGWSKSLLGIVINRVHPDSSGNVFLLGNVAYPVAIPSESSSKDRLDILQGDATCLIKLNLSGAVLWTCTWDSLITQDFNIASDGSIFVYGIINQVGDADPGPGIFNIYGNFQNFILKLNSEGDFLWALTLESAIKYIYDVALTTDGSAYIIGEAQTWLSSAPGVSTPTRVSDDYWSLIKVSDEGSINWSRCWGGPFGTNHGAYIDVDPDGNAYVAGDFFMQTVLDPISNVETTSQGLFDVFISKYNPQGDLLWLRTYGGRLDDSPGDLFINQGELKIYGYFESTPDFDPGPSVCLGDLPDSNKEIYGNYISCFDLDGNFLWVNTSIPDLYDLAFDSSGSLYIAGGGLNSVSISKFSNIGAQQVK
jgi:hypothetical protein